jgi:iron-sulfur cluster assembly protein
MSETSAAAAVQESPSVTAAAAAPAAATARKAPPKNGILITKGAAEFAGKRLAKRGTPDAAIRLGVKGGSCSGYSYVIQYEDNPPRERDYVYEEGGIRFIVDKKSFLFLVGSTLDFENTLMFQGFKFLNPHETQKCGCGHSFNVR